MPSEPPKHCAQCGGPLQAIAGKPGQLLCTRVSCGKITYLSPVPVVAAIVEREGHIVLVRGHGWPESWYGLVTGFLEPNENPSDAARREVREELGLATSEIRLVGAYAFPQMNQVIIAYHLRAEGEIVLDPGELAGLKLVPVEKLRPWDFGTGAAVRDFLASRRGAPSAC